MAFSGWALGLSGVTLSTTASEAWLWQYILDVSAILLPFLYFIFILQLLNIKAKYLKYFLLTCVVLLLFFSFSPLFKVGMTIRYGFNWVNPGPYYFVFLIYFIFCAIITIGYLFYGYFKAEKGSVLRKQIRNTIFGGIMGYGGGVTNFFPQLFAIYPFGNYLVILYIVFMVYGVLRFKLLNTKVISAQIFSTALILVSFFNLLKATELIDWLVNFFIFLLAIVFSIFLINSVNREVKAREILALTNIEQENLIHIISHQIKGYLSKSRNIFAELLTEPAYGPVADASRPMLREGLRSLTEGVRFTQQILNASNVDKGNAQFSMQIIDLKNMVKDLVKALKEIAEKKGLEFNVEIEDGDYHTMADDIQMKEALRNIIDNSIHYTPVGKITVSLAHRAEYLVFAVKDTGIGMTDDVKKKLFTKGGRGKESLKINVNSTGYGLFFVKKVIEAHHGRVHAESEGKDRGSVFTVELPEVKHV